MIKLYHFWKVQHIGLRTDWVLNKTSTIDIATAPGTTTTTIIIIIIIITS